MDLVAKYKPDVLYFDDTVLPFYPIRNEGFEILNEYYALNKSWHNGRNEGVVTGKVLDVIPAGELLYRQAVERERAEAARQRAALVRSWVILALSVLAFVMATGVLVFVLRRSRRRAQRLGITLDAERRRTGE